MAKTSKRVSVEKLRLQRVNTDRIWLKNSKIFVACQRILPYSHPSDVIQYLRTGEGLTLDQTAERLGVHKTTVSRWTPPDVVGLQHYTEQNLKASLRCVKEIHARRRQRRLTMQTDTITRALAVITEIVDNATIAISRNRYDFYADRLRVATTEPDLLTGLNRYSELLGSPVLTQKSIKDAMRASAAEDAPIVYQWLRDQPKVAIAMAKLKYDDRAEVVEALVSGYQPQQVQAGLLKPRRPFDINITATVTQALAHGDDGKAGNAQLFRRCDVRGGLRLPFYSGNAIGGAMRDLLADHFLQALGLWIDKADPALNIWAFHLLYSGGIMADGAIPKTFERVLTGAASGSMRSDGVRQLRNMIPFFSMLGGIGKNPMESYIYINDLRPQCLEWGTGDDPVSSLMTWRYIARRDDYEGRTSKAQRNDGDAGDDTANTSMLANTECLTEGTVLEGGIDVSPHATEIEMAALARGLQLLQGYGYLGGKKHRGYGRVNIEYQTNLTLNPTPYDDYLQANKAEIIKYLHSIEAFPEDGQPAQLGLLSYAHS